MLVITKELEAILAPVVELYINNWEVTFALTLDDIEAVAPIVIGILGKLPKMYLPDDVCQESF